MLGMNLQKPNENEKLFLKVNKNFIFSYLIFEITFCDTITINLQK